MKIYVVIGSGSGVDLHRLVLPHQELKKQEPDWEITLGRDISVDNLGKYDLVIFNRIINLMTLKQLREKYSDSKVEIKEEDLGRYNRLYNFEILEELRQKYPKVKVVMDLDDYWKLDSNSVVSDNYKNFDLETLIRDLIPKVDLVTTTTTILANKIKPLNPNVKILPNALIQEKQFIPKNVPSDLVRIGLIGGITHFTDVELLRGVVNSLPQKVKDKVQFVLCGFDKFTIIDSEENEIIGDWRENKWNHLERILSDNYKLVSPEHYKELMKYLYKIDIDPKEHYRRIWARNVINYGTLYNEIDVLLVPLKDTNFNRCKSELKLIEASIMGKAAIVSDVFPYKLCGINAVEHGGKVNPEGNCIMVDERKGAKGWAKAITKMVEDSEFREMTRKNLQKLTEYDYNLSEVTRKRKEAYEKILAI